MKVSIEVEGTERLQKIFARAAVDAGARKALEQSMFGFATKILNESKKMVPLDTGNLRNSGKVMDPKTSAGVIEVEVTYGGSAAPYAQIVHEDMTMDHSPANLTAVTKRPRRGQAKYLEIPVRANAPEFARSIAERYIRYFRRGA
jgi:hypothetical protein